MNDAEFQNLVKKICECESLPMALSVLSHEESLPEVAKVAQKMTGHFSLAEIDGEKRIYHISSGKNSEGEIQEFVEHVMNEGDDIIKFVVWFFTSQFDVKARDIYRAAGRTGELN